MFEILFKYFIVSELIMRTKWFLVNLQHHVLEVFPAIVFDSDQSRSAVGTPQVRIDHPLGQFEGRKGAKRFPLRLLRPLLLLNRNQLQTQSKTHIGPEGDKGRLNIPFWFENTVKV